MLFTFSKKIKSKKNRSCLFLRIKIDFNLNNQIKIAKNCWSGQNLKRSGF